MTTSVRTERGSATVLAAAAALALVMAATAAVLVVAVVLASHRARVAADLAALAGASAEAGGGEACAAAGANARENGAEITTCHVTGDASSFVVVVTVTAATGLTAPLPELAGADARAGTARA